MFLKANSPVRFLPEGNVFGGEISSLNEPPPTGLPKGDGNASGLVEKAEKTNRPQQSQTGFYLKRNGSVQNLIWIYHLFNTRNHKIGLY